MRDPVIYKCKNCKKKFASRQDPNAEKVHDKPQCSFCKERVKN